METVVGLSIQQPVLDALRNRPEFAAWNELSRVDSVVTGMIDKVRGSELISSNDFGGFDRTLVGELIHEVFDVIRWWFNKSARTRIDWLERQILTVGLVTPEGVISGRDGAMPSGSALTNLVDTLVTLLLFGAGTSLGDDSLKIVADSDVIPDYSKLLADQAGMILSDSKGLVDRDLLTFYRDFI